MIEHRLCRHVTEGHTAILDPDGSVGVLVVPGWERNWVVSSEVRTTVVGGLSFESVVEHCDGRANALEPVIARQDAPEEPAPDRLHADPMTSARGGPVGLLRDLQDLYQLANLTDITWVLVGQAAYGARDRELIALVGECSPQVVAQVDWLRMRMKSAAPQTLLVAT